jgi:hypothetical protein
MCSSFSAFPSTSVYLPQIISMRFMLRPVSSGCRWCATRYAFTSNASTSTLAPILPTQPLSPDQQHGAGCVDPVSYYILRWLHDGGPTCDLDNSVNGFSQPGGNSSVVPTTAGRAQVSAFLGNFSTILNVSIEDYPYCSSLPPRAAAPIRYDPYYDHCRQVTEDTRTRLIIALVGGFFVFAYALLMSRFAQCPCVRRGTHRRLTVCVCQCGGCLCFLFFCLHAMAWSLLGVVCLSLMQSSPFPVLWSMLWSKLMAFVWQALGCFLWFSLRWCCQVQMGIFVSYRPSRAGSTAESLKVELKAPLIQN